jgi:hypothetical protein
MIFKAILVTPMMVFACWALSSAARAATCSNASRSGTYRFPHSGTAGDGTPILGLSDPSQLHFRLSQADPCNDEPDIFRSRLLRAFGRAGFLRFQALASALEQESRDAMVMAVMRSGILGHPERRSVDFGLDLKPADRQFYE